MVALAVAELPAIPCPPPSRPHSRACLHASSPREAPGHDPRVHPPTLTAAPAPRVRACTHALTLGSDNLAQGQGQEDGDDKLLDHLLHGQLDVAPEPRKLHAHPHPYTGQHACVCIGGRGCHLSLCGVCLFVGVIQACQRLLHAFARACHSSLSKTTIQQQSKTTKKNRYHIHAVVEDVGRALKDANTHKGGHYTHYTHREATKRLYTTHRA
jgi:hypothetical protein